MTDIVERLRVPSDTEEVMKAWDTLRSYLLDGNKGSYARDIFESILSRIDEEREEAAGEISGLRDRIDRLEKAAQAVIAQWDTPNWKLTEPTAKLIEDLRAAIGKEGE